MKHRNRYKTMFLASLASCVVCLSTIPAATSHAAAKGVVVQLDKATLHAHLKALGHKRRGGIGRNDTESGDSHSRSLTHFSSAFYFNGVKYPYTMLGSAPESGKSTSLRSVIVPLRMHFKYFGSSQDVNVDFDPMPAVDNIVNSPIFQDAQFATASDNSAT